MLEGCVYLHFCNIYEYPNVSVIENKSMWNMFNCIYYRAAVPIFL